MRSGIQLNIKSCCEAALAFFYPEVCQYCHNGWAGPREGFICHDCSRNVRAIRTPFCERCGLPFDGALSGPFECSNCRDLELEFTFGRAAVAAEGMVLDLIHRWKYQRALWLEPFLASLLIREAHDSILRGQWDLIVPVPLHPLKEREREFNQAERLARRVSLATRVPFSRTLLRRICDTPTQTRLSRAERSGNMRRAFVSTSPETVRGRRIVLIDDVLTTGATTSACAGVLRAAGVADVCVWTLARGLLH